MASRIPGWGREGDRSRQRRCRRMNLFEVWTCCNRRAMRGRMPSRDTRLARFYTDATTAVDDAVLGTLPPVRFLQEKKR